MTPDSTRLRPAYIAYYVQTRPYWDWIANNSVRSGQPGINSKEYGSLPVPIPPLPEQDEIGSVLSDADELIGSLETLAAKKRAIPAGRNAAIADGQDAAAGVWGGVGEGRPRSHRGHQEWWDSSHWRSFLLGRPNPHGVFQRTSRHPEESTSSQRPAISRLVD